MKPLTAAVIKIKIDSRIEDRNIITAYSAFNRPYVFDRPAAPRA